MFNRYPQTHISDDKKHTFIAPWHVFFDVSSSIRHTFIASSYVLLPDWMFFGQEIFILYKFWFRRSTQNTFKPLVWHLLHQNILNISDFMKVYEKLIIFIKSLIFNIFWWEKCLTIGLKVFWVDLRNQNLSKVSISFPKNIQLEKNIYEI